MLAQLLFEHWVTHPGSSWLVQLSFDIMLVGMYVPTIFHVLPKDNPVPSLLDALVESPTWVGPAGLPSMLCLPG